MTSKSDFEAWWSSDKSQFTQDDELKAFAWEVWQVSRVSVKALAYMSHHGSAISPDDFKGGAKEMHLTARQEGWTPLIAGITVKGEGDGDIERRN